MRKSPFTDIDDAYEPMFDETLTLRRKNGEQTTIEAAVFIDNTAEPFSDDMMETECEQIDIVVKKTDYPFVKLLERGDTIIRSCYKEKDYAVQDVMNDNVLGLVITARSK